jgi:iduronate 2-sulfatase
MRLGFIWMVLLSGISALVADAKPNVLFIVCDDLNTHVSSSGYANIETPNFDRLAARGMTFDRAYCQYPVCGPSRASFLHGLYPEVTGVLDNTSDIRQTRPGSVSMPQAFKEQGYWTAATGKIFHNAKVDQGAVTWNEVERFSNEELPIERSAREAFEAEHGSITARENRNAWKTYVQGVATQTRGQQTPGYGPSGLTNDQHADGKNALQAMAWLDDQAFGDKPFFMAVGIHKPHVPFLAPEAYFDLYPREELRYVKTPADFWDQAPSTAMVKRYEGFGFEFAVENDALRREFMQAYHACISFIDAQIGRIFDSLERNNLWDDTIVVLISDHGYQLGEHFMWGKVTLFETCARVPMVIHAPGVSDAAGRSQALVELVDLYPTLAELCGIETPTGLQGRSLVPNLTDSRAEGKSATYTVVTRGDQLGKAIRTQDWRYALWPNGEELYHLKEDLLEHTNLANDPAHRTVLEDMRARLPQFVSE